MALFGKKMSLDEILKAIDTLTPDEQAKVKAKVEDLYKAEDEREIDKIEEVKGDNELGKEEVNEESEKIAKDVDEIESEVKTDEVDDKVDNVDNVDKVDNVETEVATDETAKDNTAEIIEALTNRLNELETRLNEFEELKTAMDDYNKKTAERFGYKGSMPKQNKGLDEMSSSELKKDLLTEI